MPGCALPSPFPALPPSRLHGQSTKSGANAYGSPVPIPSSKEAASSPEEDEEDAGSSLAESVRTESASSREVDSSEEEEGGNRRVPHKKNGRSAHRGRACNLHCLPAGPFPDVEGGLAMRDLPFRRPSLWCRCRGGDGAHGTPSKHGGTPPGLLTRHWTWPHAGKSRAGNSKPTPPLGLRVVETPVQQKPIPV